MINFIRLYLQERKTKALIKKYSYLSRRHGIDHPECLQLIQSNYDNKIFMEEVDRILRTFNAINRIREKMKQ